jgi:23S rRNA (uracil1939-C5)-methyltransferase
MSSIACSLQDTCGGCPEMGHSAEVQLRRKVQSVERYLGREVDLAVSSPKPLGYRARIEMRPDEEGRLGYFRPRSHDHVAVPHCPVAREEINAVLGGLPPMPAGLKSLQFRSNGSEVVLSARSARADHGRVANALRQLGLMGSQGIALDGKKLAGDDRLVFAEMGLRHSLGPLPFYQVNLEVNALLVARVLESIAALSPTKVLDLYAGAGNFSLPLAAQGHPVLMVESQGESLADARRTAEAHELPIEQLRADASRLRAGEHFFDVALLDPPRAGAPGVISSLVLTRPRALVYVSCHAPSLARDLKEATAAGYRVRELSLFDMFPQTPHCEVLCVLER